jgi:hypothetical protein
MILTEKLANYVKVGEHGIKSKGILVVEWVYKR